MIQNKTNDIESGI